MFGRGFDSHRLHIYFLKLLKTSQNIDNSMFFIFILSILSHTFLKLTDPKTDPFLKRVCPDS
nr:MAG TPA: hypothetical protein [Caudoviricetes sp.]DAP54402.1 MAG TPA: hypothetical protein [Caudoviricetes sp.]